MAMINFGVGRIITVPQKLADGTAIANPTPVIIGDLQDVSVDMSVEMKTLRGNKRYPIAAGQAGGKIEIKAKYAKLDGGILGSLFLGKAATTGIKAVKLDDAYTIPATPGPYTVTMVPPSSGTFVADMGVVFTATGVQLTRVASAPATGEYSLNASTGVYTFAAADQGKAIKVSYEYSAATGGQIWTMTNETMGYMPSFTLMLQNSYDGKNLVCKLNRAVSNKFALPLKADDFAIYDFEAEAFSDAADELGYICLF